MKILGYGSLLQEESLTATVPNASNIKPAYIKGFKRAFTLWDPIGWTETNLDVANVPFCGLDVFPAGNDSSVVNGITFEVTESEMPALLEREKEYNLITTPVYDFKTNVLDGECLVFSSGKVTGEYVFGLPGQERYLEVCMEGAQAYGDEFYKMFCDTTFIGDTPIRNITMLNK